MAGSEVAKNVDALATDAEAKLRLAQQCATIKKE